MVYLVHLVHQVPLDPSDPGGHKVSLEVKDPRVNEAPRVRLDRLEPLDRKVSRDRWVSVVWPEQLDLLALPDELASQVDQEKAVTKDPLDQRDVLVHGVHSRVRPDYRVMHYNVCYKLIIVKFS